MLKLKNTIADKLVFAKIRARTGGQMKFFVSGGAALPREFGEFFEAIGLTVIEGYGLTETSPVLTVNRLEAYKFGSVGQVIPGVTLKIAEDGEILARGPNIMQGYWNNPDATAELIDKEGWFHTGDIGVIDSDGYVYITDRKKHLFVSSGGKNIAPQPIENLFLSSKYIEQFVLIGDRRMFLTALIVKNEMKCELVTGRDGTLTFRERGYDPMAGKYVVDGVALEYAENNLDGRGSPLPDACPHCGHAIDEKRTITPVVARCANEACARLIYAGMQHA